VSEHQGAAGIGRNDTPHPETGNPDPGKQLPTGGPRDGRGEGIGFVTALTTQVAFPAGSAPESIEEFKALYESKDGAGSTVRIPRVLLFVHSLTDSAVKVMVHRTNRTFLDNPFGWERLAARLRQSGINDAALRERFLRFLAG
jgi:hypothetical protein